MTITQIHLENNTVTELGPDAPRPTSADRIIWLDVSPPTEDDFSWLGRKYNFHPLTIEDCRNFDQRAKVEAYDDYLFLSLTAAVRNQGDVTPREMEAFLGTDYLITVHREPLPSLEAVRKHYGASPHAGSGHVDFLLYEVVDHMVDEYFPILDEMEDEIDALEDEILAAATQSTLHRIFALKQQLVLLRKIAAPMREVMNALAGTRFALIDPRTALYFRDAYDHLTRIYDLVETSRDLLGNSLDAYLSTISNRLSEVMKRLTLLTTVFMPVSFLVGFGGMNFQQLPFDNPMALAVLLLLLLLVPILMMIWFWRSRWV